MCGMWDRLKENYNLDIIENMAINYSAMDEWKKFISDYVIPLRDSAEALVDYWNYLKGKIEGVEVDEIGDDLKPILLGGVDEEGNYLEDSVAKFYKDFFGVSLNVELPKYAIAVREGATKGIKGVITQWNEASSPTDKDPFIRFIVNVATQTKRIINAALAKGIIDTIAESQSIDYEAMIKNPEEGLKLIEDFYNNCAKITPNYNEHTLFILTIRTITRRYLEEAYPQFKDKFAKLQSLLGLKRLFEPDIEDRTKKAEYTIWHLPEGSFGGEVRKLYEMIWNYSSAFEELLSQYFEEIVDLKKEFIEDAKVKVFWLPSEIVEYDYEKFKSGHGEFHFPFSFDFSNGWFKGMWESPYNLLKLSRDELDPEVTYSSRGNPHRHYKPKKPIFISKLLDELLPLLFIGLVNVKNVSENRFEIEPL